MERERGVRGAERIEDMVKSGEGRAERAEDGGERVVLREERDQSWWMAEWKVLREECV